MHGTQEAAEALTAAVSLGPRFRRESAAQAEERLEQRAIARAKQGDWDAVHFLYVRYADDVRSFVASIVRSHHDAEDVTQAIFARLLKAIGRYEQHIP